MHCFTRVCSSKTGFCSWAQLAKRLQAPHVPSAKLHGELKNTYKIKLRDTGYRLIYEVIDQRVVVFVIAVGRRDHDTVYQHAAQRHKP